MDDQLHLLTGAYALNALDDDERRRFERALPFGHPVAEEARELSETAALLAAGATPVAPPAGLKARLMAQVAVTPQLEVVPQPEVAPQLEVVPQPEAESPANRAAESAGEVSPAEVSPEEVSRAELWPAEGAHHDGVPAESASADRPTRPLAGVESERFGERRRRAFSVGSRWLAAAAAVLLVAAGGAGLWGLRAQQQRDDAVRELAAAQSGRSAVMDRILSAPDAKIEEVAVPGGATMLIAHSKEAQLAGVVTIGMSPAPQGKDYELWLIDAGGTAKAAGLVAAGDGSTWNELSGGIDGASYLGVTVEPKGGSHQPTTKPILLESLA